MQTTIRAMRPEDWPAVRDIWAQGIQTGDATFTQKAADYAVWDSGHLPLCRLTAERNGRVAGWAALSPVYRAPAYAGLAEVSVYVDAACRRAGVGAAIMAELIKRSEQSGIWMLESSIMADNAASIALHQKFGFSITGGRAKVAKDINGVWRDTVLMNRRSALPRYR